MFRDKAWVLLLVLGLLTMVGDLGGLPALKGFGAATAASPAPKVFSSVRGYETYSTRFLVEWTDVEGTPRTLELTPEVYAQLRGPYNRRNVLGAVMAYGPVLSTTPATAPMFHAVAGYALAGEAPLLREMGIDPAMIQGPVRLRFLPRPGTLMGDLPVEITVEAP